MSRRDGILRFRRRNIYTTRIKRYLQRARRSGRRRRRRRGVDGVSTAENRRKCVITACFYNVTYAPDKDVDAKGIRAHARLLTIAGDESGSRRTAVKKHRRWYLFITNGSGTTVNNLKTRRSNTDA